MNILILGGTQFVGRTLTEITRARGHQVTLFNRGKTNQTLFSDVETLIGDRDGGLDLLHGRSWDAVIDTCGYLPRLVRDSGQLLQHSVKQYVFISSISVFASMASADQDEGTSLGEMPNGDNSVEEINGETYGPLKVLCEQVLHELYPENHLIIRPGLITGPYDHTDRFGYWPWRLSRGGDVLVPGRPERPIQHIDVRDLATWLLKMVEQTQHGTYNATGPATTQTMGDLIAACQALSKEKGPVHWLDEQFLLDQEVTPWQELPFWIPELNEESHGFMRVNCQKAIQAGLTFRPLAETVGDFLAWHNTRPDHQWKVTLTPEKEQSTLATWSTRDS